MKKTIFTIFCFTLSGFSYSANQTIPADRKIEKLTVYTSSVLVTFSPSFEALDQPCTSNSKDTISLDTGGNENNEMYSAILAAANSKTKIGFGVGECVGQYPKIYRVDTSFYSACITSISSGQFFHYAFCGVYHKRLHYKTAAETGVMWPW